jgi:hypothetical protein
LSKLLSRKKVAQIFFKKTDKSIQMIYQWAKIRQIWSPCPATLFLVTLHVFVFVSKVFFVFVSKVFFCFFGINNGSITRLTIICFFTNVSYVKCLAGPGLPDCLFSNQKSQFG